MRQVRDLIGTQGAAATPMLRPAKHSRLKEGAVDDQLRAALEEIEQANLALWPLELVFPLHRHPGHPSTLGGQRVTGSHMRLLLHEELLSRSVPLLLRDDGGRFYRDSPFSVFFVSKLKCCHLIFPFFL